MQLKIIKTSKMNKYLLILLGLIIFIGVGCEKSESNEDDEVLTIEDLLVKDNEITGWSYAGVRWVANNITELTEFINGGAEIYQNHGFKEATQQSYNGTIENGTRTMQLFIYDMNTNENAKAVYDDPNLGLSGATDWLDGAGVEAHYVRFGGLSQKLSFYRDKYFVLIDINFDTDESLNIVKQFALNVDGKIQ